MAQKTFAETLYGFLERIELILVTALGVSLLTQYLKVAGAATGIQLSLSGLAGVYFLMAYRPPAQAPSGEKKGFSELLSLTILPKVLWIGCAVGAIGILFQLLKLDGAREMLTIHASTGGIGIILLAVLSLQQGNDSNPFIPVLYRAVPLLLVTLYMLLM